MDATVPVPGRFEPINQHKPATSADVKRMASMAWNRAVGTSPGSPGATPDPSPNKKAY